MKKRILRNYYIKNGTFVGALQSPTIQKLYGKIPTMEEILIDVGVETKGSLSVETKFKMIELTSARDIEELNELLGTSTRRSSMSIAEYEDWKVPSYKVIDNGLTEKEDRLLVALTCFVKDTNLVRYPKGLNFHQHFSRQHSKTNNNQEFPTEEETKLLLDSMPVIKKSSVEIQEDFVGTIRAFYTREEYTDKEIENVLNIFPKHLAWRAGYFDTLSSYKQVIRYMNSLYTGEGFFKLISLSKQMGLTIEESLNKLGWVIPDIESEYMTTGVVSYMDTDNYYKVATSRTNGHLVSMEHQVFAKLLIEGILDQVEQNKDLTHEPTVGRSKTPISEVV